MIGKIQKWGNSNGIRIPKQLLAIASLQEGEDVELIAVHDRIIIKRISKKINYTIQELFDGYKGERIPGEEEWGPPVGGEEW